MGKELDFINDHIDDCWLEESPYPQIIVIFYNLIYKITKEISQITNEISKNEHYEQNEQTALYLAISDNSRAVQ